LKNFNKIISCVFFYIALTHFSSLFAQDCGNCTQGMQDFRRGERPKGPTGPQRLVRPTSRHSGILTFCNPYSLVNQYIFGESVILLEESGIRTRDIDASNSGINGEIIVNATGAYLIFYSATGRSADSDNYNDAWSIGIYIDGVLDAGTVKAGTSNSKDEFETVTGYSLAVIKAGQTVTLQNVSTHPIELLSNVSGNNSVPNISAAVDLVLLTSGTTF
jgi:hypothetical protein